MELKEQYRTYEKGMDRIIPDFKPLIKLADCGSGEMLKTHCRTDNLFNFNVLKDKFVKREKLLSKHFKNIIEISCRAAYCPMPMNMDVWDGTKCYGCCVAGTKIQMMDESEKNIEDVKIGERVLSWDISKEQITNSEVVINNKRNVEETYIITLESGKQIEVSEEHPFLTKRGWIEAKDLTEDDEVLEYES